MRYLGIDYGLKRTGLAICDAGETISSPLKVLQTDKYIEEKIVEIIRSQQVEAIVIGMPLNMDGSRGPQAKFVEKFGNKLENHVTIPVLYHDERLSSFGAEDKLIAAELTRGKKKKILDAIAAAEILQGFLDHRHGKTD